MATAMMTMMMMMMMMMMITMILPSTMNNDKDVMVPFCRSKSNPSVLPLASTCTNSLKLPDYPTKVQ